jgi:phenol/toluene 2-monooxygenase (NADH) P3/A3
MEQAKKMNMKDKYNAMTGDLGWDFSYKTEAEIFPLSDFEGIKIEDWSKWQDPFRLTMDAYWKYQGEKERKLYAVIDAFAQNNAHLGVTDARYINTLKIFLTAVTPLEYAAHRGFALAGRSFPGVGAQVASPKHSCTPSVSTTNILMAYMTLSTCTTVYGIYLYQNLILKMHSQQARLNLLRPFHSRLNTC